MKGLGSSEIRDLLELTAKPEIISFAGGLPAPELFPIDAIKKADISVLETDGMAALQYSTVEGFAPLREWVAERMNKRLGTSYAVDNIMVVHGSQQALDLAGMVFLDEDDVVLCESPTYLAAISAFRAYGCKFVDVATNEEGMDMAELEAALEKYPEAKLIYVIPDFQNPTGRTWSLERRKEFAELTARYGIAVLEDNPYGELRFEGDYLPAVKSFDKVGNVFNTGTFSKIFCPGYRIGWMAAEPALIEQFIMLKQGVDLQSNTIAQRVIMRFLEQNDIDEHIDSIREVYRKRRDLTIATMKEHFPPEVTFTEPEGGLFCWAVLPENVNTKELLLAAVEKKVAFVPGGSFFANGGHENTMRINFSNMPEDKIVSGLKTLGEVIKDFILAQGA
jgi:2-aminoadipate transaminase